MRYVRLIAATDEYDTEPGLALKACSRTYDGFMADRLGGLIAHDLIEHQNGAKNIGPIDDELEASGGVWHTRGRWGDFGNHFYTPAQQVGSDIANMFRDQGFWTIPLNGVRPHEDIEDDLDEVIIEAKRLIKAEADDEDDLSDVNAYLEAARRRFRIGYRKANRRFGGDYTSNSTYQRIRQAVASTVKHIDYEGQEFVLAYDQYNANIREVELNYDYH